VTLVTDAVPDDRYGMNSIRLATAAAAAMCLGAFLPSVASATDYCVYPNTSCEANNYQKLQPALDQAASTPEADRVLLGTLTYEGDLAKGFYYQGSSPVDIVGAGRGQTVLTGPDFSTDRVLLLGGAPESTVSNLTIRIPPKTAQGFRGLVLFSGTTARRIEVVDGAGPNDAHYGAAVWEGSVLEDSSVTLDSAKETTGVWLTDPLAGGPLSAVRGSVIRAKHGVDVSAGGTIERSRVIGADRAVLATGGGTSISDSLLTINGTVGAVLQAETAPGMDTNVTANGVTIFATPGSPDTGGVALSTDPDSSRNVHLTLDNSIVRAYVPLAPVALGGGGGTATIAASYSDYDSVANLPLGGTITEWHVSNVGDAGFDENTGREYWLLPTSPLLDKGDPDAPQGLDVNGDPRVADGNGDGFARRDLGAFELQPAMAGPPPGGGTSGGPAADTKAPVVSGFRAARARLRFAHGTRFRYMLSENARVTLRFKRIGRRGLAGALRQAGTDGVNRIRFTGRIGRRALRPGRYRVAATAVDAAGNRSVPRLVRVQILR
jgi:hypothetical protein